MNLKTVAGWAAIAFVAWWAIENPASAEHVVRHTGAFLTAAANGISRFFTSI